MQKLRDADKFKFKQASCDYICVKAGNYSASNSRHHLMTSENSQV